MIRLAKLALFASERGLKWTTLYGVRWILVRCLGFLEGKLIELEQRRLITGESTVSSLSHTRQENKRLWDEYDWSGSGEEWTPSAEWKQSVVDLVILKYIRPGSTVLEVGPGGGRWTEILQPIAGRLLLVDISERCLTICKRRFAGCKNVEYYLTTGTSLKFIPDSSIDFVWSYDVFVHINPADTQTYLREFRRVLAPGGYAAIHHSGGKYPSKEEAQRGWRSHMNGRLFTHLVATSGLQLIGQSEAAVHKQGDVISVFMKELSGSPVAESGHR